MIWTIVATALTASCLVEAHRHKVAYCLGDEIWSGKVGKVLALSGWRGWRGFIAEYRVDIELINHPGPLRLLWWAHAALAGRYKRTRRVLAVMSSTYAVLATLGASMLGTELGVPWAGLAVAASPLMLGVGRRAMGDTMHLALALWAMVLLEVHPWAALPVLVALMLSKESALLQMPALAVFAWFLRGWGVAWVFAVAVPAWYLVAWVALGRCPILLGLYGLLRAPPNEWARQHCGGGLHRLVVDLAMQNPVVLVLGCAGIALGDWQLGAVIAVAAAPIAALVTEVRLALLVDVLLRIVAVRVFGPWWIMAILAVDLYVWQRAWVRAGVAEAMPTSMVPALGMFQGR